MRTSCARVMSRERTRWLSMLAFPDHLTTAIAKLLESRSYPADEIGTHAGLADTSLTVALDPSLVRGERLRPGKGDNGDPSRASVTLGAQAVELIVSNTIEAIRREAGWR